MIRLMLSIVVSWLVLCTAVLAQDQALPFARVEVAPREVPVGKPVKVTVTLFVPTWFREDPDFPVYEAMNVNVKTAGQDMRPMTEVIDGIEWTGTSQTYWMYPMDPGEFSFPKKHASGMYTNPSDNSGVMADIEIESFWISAIVPVGAKDLDPLIVADGLTLEQSWEGPVDGVAEGEAITRTIAATIEGSSALFLPALIPPQASDVMKAYPERHNVTDLDPLKGAGGMRTDSATYIARYGGEAVFPDVEIRWFNASTGQIETATAEGRTVTIDAPEKPKEPLVTKKQVFMLLGLLVCLVVLIWAYRKWVHPSLKQIIQDLRLRWNTSEPYAARKVVLAIRAHDLDDVFRWVLVWLKRQKVTDTETRQMFVSSLLALGRERFGDGPKEDWQKVEHAFRRMRKQAKRQDANLKDGSLPELNPS